MVNIRLTTRKYREMASTLKDGIVTDYRDLGVIGMAVTTVLDLMVSYLILGLGLIFVFGPMLAALGFSGVMVEAGQSGVAMAAVLWALLWQLFVMVLILVLIPQIPKWSPRLKQSRWSTKSVTMRLLRRSVREGITA